MIGALLASQQDEFVTLFHSRWSPGEVADPVVNKPNQAEGTVDRVLGISRSVGDALLVCIVYPLDCLRNLLPKHLPLAYNCLHVLPPGFSTEWTSNYHHMVADVCIQVDRERR